MSDDFVGFSAAGLEFLAELGSRDKTWFDDHRRTYTEEIVTPTKAFVVAMGDRLARGIAPGIMAQPKANGSIAPINNDLRFAPDERPYKDHILLRFWEGPTKKIAPTLFIRLGADDVGFATGVMLADLDRWRALIDDDATGVPLEAALERLGKGRELDIAGEGYKRVPKPYREDHPRAGLLRHKTFQARWSEPLPDSVHSAAFVDWCEDQLDACGDMHHWLVANLG